jgi:hypothetical protein
VSISHARLKEIIASQQDNLRDKTSTNLAQTATHAYLIFSVSRILEAQKGTVSSLARHREIVSTQTAFVQTIAVASEKAVITNVQVRALVR